MHKIQMLRNMHIIGNAHSDRPLFDLAHEIIVDDSQPMDHRIDAIKVIDEAMSCEQEQYSASDVYEYMDQEGLPTDNS